MLERVRIPVLLRSDFGTTPRGDTLFGQLCWALLLREGEDALARALDGYTEGKPFVILSDIMPLGYVPRCELPPPALDDKKTVLGKGWTRMKWLPEQSLASPLIRIFDNELPKQPAWLFEELQTHNSINRMTGTTGSDAFGPYLSTRLSLPEGQQASGYLVAMIDTERFSLAALVELLKDIGRTGFGRDASTGLGRFEVGSPDVDKIIRGSDHWVTLGACAPEPKSLDEARSFWRPFTRFGRHGGPAAGGRVFKTPVLLVDTGAVLTPWGGDRKGWIGRGLGGYGRLSHQIPGTVHQAYTPMMPVQLEGWHD
jgi:CRISPR-associated protein Csm4